MESDYMELTLAAARFALGKLSSEEATETASNAFDHGVCSESLVQLMIQTAVWEEVGPLFQNALTELNVAVPSRKEAVLVIAREYAREIVAGETPTYEGARRIWQELANEPDADGSLLVFVGLASEWEDVPQYRLQYEADIVEVARSLLASGMERGMPDS
jgi:hypothetical protein